MGSTRSRSPVKLNKERKSERMFRIVARYALVGIPEVWITDVDVEVVERHTEPQFDLFEFGHLYARLIRYAIYAESRYTCTTIEMRRSNWKRCIHFCLKRAWSSDPGAGTHWRLC